MSTEQLENPIHVGEPASAPSLAVDDKAQSAERAMSYALVFSAVRCSLQYVVLPFVLPVLGIAGDFPPQVFVVINVIAMVAIVSSVIRLWRINYKYKWQYLGIGIVALLIQVVFTLNDLQLTTGL